jgi:hypothetical protein
MADSMLSRDGETGVVATPDFAVEIQRTAGSRPADSSGTAVDFLEADSPSSERTRCGRTGAMQLARAAM